MHEDLIKFRKICLALLADKKLNRKTIQMETGMSESSLTKYLNAPVDELPKLRASTLGAMQDFIKNHTVDMNYAGIPSETVTGKQEWDDKHKREVKKEKFDDTFTIEDKKPPKLQDNEVPMDAF